MLSKYRVLDLTDQRGHLASLILRQLGAEVIAIEPAEGSPARYIGPFAEDVVDIERSLHHWAYNRGKKSIVIDRGTEAGRAQLRSLVQGADILFETCAPAERVGSGLDPAKLQRLNPALVHVSITPFGGNGPKADWAATDVTVQAACGNMAITGDNDRPPVRAGSLDQAFHSAASEGAAAALIGLFERQRCSGLAQHIDMSAQQSINLATQSMMMAVPINAKPAIRISGGSKLQGIDIQQMWACQDGHASVTLLFGLMLAPFTQNQVDWVHEEGFCDETTRAKSWVDYETMLIDGREPVSEYERIKDCLSLFFATKTKAELLDAAMSRRVLIAPVSTSADVIDSDQLAARGYWEAVDHGETGPFTYPGAFAKFSEKPMESLSSAPTLGLHTEDLLVEPHRSPGIAIANQGASTAPGLGHRMGSRLPGRRDNGIVLAWSHRCDGFGPRHHPSPQTGDSDRFQFPYGSDRPTGKIGRVRHDGGSHLRFRPSHRLARSGTLRAQGLHRLNLAPLVGSFDSRRDRTPPGYRPGPVHRLLPSRSCHASTRTRIVGTDRQQSNLGTDRQPRSCACATRSLSDNR